MPTRTPARLPALPFLLVLAVAAGCFALSTQSLWIDETEQAVIVLHSTLRGCWNALYMDHTSNIQMPLHFLYLWGWVRLFGGSEVALRASNIPWFFIGFFSISHFLRRHPGLRNVTLLIFCLHPFVWYYLDEARPYVMELSGAFLVFGALFDAMDQPGAPLPVSWWWLYGSGLFILCGATVVGVPWAMVVTLFLITLPAFRRSLHRSVAPALVFIPLLILLALYFAWTFREKFRSASLPMTLPSMLSVFYELLGFLGLGPGRTDLRSNSVSATAPYLVSLAFLGIPLASGFIIAARRRFCLTFGHFIFILLLTGIPVTLTFALGFLRHARMLGRHFTPLFPFILLAQACAVALLWKTGRPLGRIAAVLIVISLAASSIELRLAPRHAKDDYRSAAAAARQALAQHKIVWWAAEPTGAEYYQLPLGGPDLPGSAFSVYGMPAYFASPPDEVFLSKPDLFDNSGQLSAFLTVHHYFPAARWQGFTLWKKPPPGT
jgi:hypothetical protein